MCYWSVLFSYPSFPSDNPFDVPITICSYEGYVLILGTRALLAKETFASFPFVVPVCFFKTFTLQQIKQYSYSFSQAKGNRFSERHKAQLCAGVTQSLDSSLVFVPHEALDVEIVSMNVKYGFGPISSCLDSNFFPLQDWRFCHRQFEIQSKRSSNFVSHHIF